VGDLLAFVFVRCDAPRGVPIIADAEVSTDRPVQLSAAGQRRVLAVLCVTQIVSWGVLYYAFPVLAPSIAADTGWSVSAVTAAFSAETRTWSAGLGAPSTRS
jgi:hypothetical protein